MLEENGLIDIGENFNSGYVRPDYHPDLLFNVRKYMNIGVINPTWGKIGERL